MSKGLFNMQISSTGGFPLQHSLSIDFNMQRIAPETFDKDRLAFNDQKQKSTEMINTEIKPENVGLKFKYHDELKEYYVAIIDPITSEVIKEIPPKQLLDKYAAMAQYMGLLIDRRL